MDDKSKKAIVEEAYRYFVGDRDITNRLEIIEDEYGVDAASKVAELILNFKLHNESVARVMMMLLDLERKTRSREVLYATVDMLSNYKDVPGVLEEISLVLLILSDRNDGSALIREMKKLQSPEVAAAFKAFDTAQDAASQENDAATVGQTTSVRWDGVLNGDKIANGIQKISNKFSLLVAYTGNLDFPISALLLSSEFTVIPSIGHQVMSFFESNHKMAKLPGAEFAVKKCRDALKDSGALEILKRFEGSPKAAEAAAGLLLSVAINASQPIVALKYYCALLSTSEASRNVKSISAEPMTDDEFLRVANECLGSGSADFNRFIVARAIFRFGNGSGKLDEIRKVFDGSIDPEKKLGECLKDAGVENPDVLSKEEKLILLGAGYILFRDHVGSINEFVKRRSPDHKDSLDAPSKLKGIFEKANCTETIGVVHANGSRSGITRRDAISALVCGIHGSKSPEKRQDAIKFLSEIFLPERIEAAGAAWTTALEYTNGEILQKLYSAYARLSVGGEDEVLSVFKRASELVKEQSTSSGLKEQLKAAEALSDMVDKIKGMSDSDDTEVGNQIIVSSTKGKGNVITISSARIGCCAFLPSGESKESALYYSNDPGILLPTFSIGHSRSVQQPQDLRVSGTAISAIGISENGKAVFYIDSVEGGMDFDRAITGKEAELVRVLEGYAARKGFDKIAFSTTPRNETPRRFAAVVRDREGYQEQDGGIRLLLRSKQFLEADMRDNVVRSQVLVKNLSKS